jgi:hypothetical protein
MNDEVGWVFFTAFFIMFLAAFALTLVAVRLAAQVNQARDILKRVERNTTGALHDLILEYLERTRP